MPRFAHGHSRGVVGAAFPGLRRSFAVSAAVAAMPTSYAQAAARTRTPGGDGRVDVYASKRLMHNPWLRTRADNAGDEAYELARPDNTCSRDARVWLRWPLWYGAGSSARSPWSPPC